MGEGVLLEEAFSDLERRLYVACHGLPHFDATWGTILKALREAHDRRPPEAPRGLYALCGRLGSGKDTFADLLIRHDPRFVKVSFARRLKDICREVFDLSEEDVSDPQGKERRHGSPIHLDAYVPRLRELTGLDRIQPQGCVAHTSRQVLQYVGTEYVRLVDPDYWARVLMASLAPDGHYVVTDCRFANEAQAVRAWGGRIIHVLRVGRTEAPAAHASEALDFEADFTLGVREGDFSLPAYVANLSAEDRMDVVLRAVDWEAHHPPENTLDAGRARRFAESYYAGLTRNPDRGQAPEAKTGI